VRSKLVVLCVLTWCFPIEVCDRGSEREPTAAEIRAAVETQPDLSPQQQRDFEAHVETVLIIERAVLRQRIQQQLEIWYAFLVVVSVYVGLHLHSLRHDARAAQLASRRVYQGHFQPLSRFTYNEPFHRP
jgi:hypothetical protein